MVPTLLPTQGNHRACRTIDLSFLPAWPRRRSAPVHNVHFTEIIEGDACASTFGCVGTGRKPPMPTTYARSSASIPDRPRSSEPTTSLM